MLIKIVTIARSTVGEKNWKLSPGPCYTNLVNHLATSHPRYGETHDESQRTLVQSFEAYGFVDQHTIEIFKWKEWVISRNTAINEVDAPM
ncbi:hypothetical protein PHMEG_00014121 [Phytophthora megakarya]|uniref:Uncharacterized protein n=1 Tax=Phytophthora megakarya TaxID=4795 RepID=A0A225W5P0_9STRA|nr:hypothetical protein PHMEG_00014121 [Phytophthora megakarya]